MRKEFTSEERNINPYHHIDPGFINYRKCFSTFGLNFIALFENFKRTISNDDDDLTKHWKKMANNHIVVDLALKFCLKNDVKSLSESLRNLREGIIFCSTEELEGNKEVWEKERIRNRVLLPYDYEKEIYLEFGTEHFVASTGKTEQSKRYKVSIIGQIRKIENKTIVIHPIIMGAPTFDHSLNEDITIDLTWYGQSWFENFPEDIDEFSKIKDVDDPSPEEWMEYMKNILEKGVKNKFCEILSDIPKKDWGGEQDDHFSVSTRLSGERVSTAFLLKGPGEGFREMTPEMLGKRADQIYRMASTPAQLLIVQHCHSIGEAVRATLRAFAVTPHNPRRYCLIDGRDTYKILKTYGML